MTIDLVTVSLSVLAVAIALTALLRAVVKRCPHSWSEIGRSFARIPMPNLWTPSRLTLEGVHWWNTMVEAKNDRATRGETTVELRCDLCGDRACRVLPGDHTRADAKP